MRASRRTGAWTASSSWGTYPGENLDALRTIGVPIVLVDSYVTGSGFHTPLASRTVKARAWPPNT